MSEFQTLSLHTAALVEPRLDVSRPVAQVPSDPDGWGAKPLVPPRIQRSDRDVEEQRKLLGGHDGLFSKHRAILPDTKSF